MFENQLLQVPRFQHEREFVEAANLARQLDASHQIDRHIDAVATEVVQKPVLNIL